MKALARRWRRVRLCGTLRLRFSLILTLLAATLLLSGGIGWMRETRAAIGEEVEAATRVALQWLGVAAHGAETGDPAWISGRLLAHVAAVGRIRANELTVFDADGRLVYRSPGSSYKAGRSAPAWFSGYFAQALAPSLQPRTLRAGPLTLVLTPDSSRAVLDAWDDLRVFAGWALAALAGLFAACWLALRHALQPLGAVMQALGQLGNGRFDTRLPVFQDSELGQLAGAFNGMADRLDAAVEENIRLGREQDLTRTVQAHLESERQAIARELHDELSQGITAVRALAGAIIQRTEAQPDLHGHAQSIVAVTSQMQQDVRAILHRLRNDPGMPPAEVLDGWLTLWQERHPEIALRRDLAALAGVPAAPAQAALRIVQESLTNVVRHARARTVSVRVQAPARDMLCVEIEDDGCGTHGASAATRGSGLGLRGMRERAEALGGHLECIDGPRGGLCVRACLPVDPSLELAP